MTEPNETNGNIDEQEQLRQKLLWTVKREVKQIMEEAVMKKCVHEENCSVITLSGAVEACLLHGLKRRCVGLFKTSTTMALLQKIAKTCPSAAEVLKIVDNDSRRCVESTNIFTFSKKLSNNEENRRRSIRSAMYNRYLWIRTALIHRSLCKVVEYIVNSSSKYYEHYALVSNSVQGPIFASLLVGPCAIEFTRLQISDHLWTNSNANELVQRHRMHSANRIWTNNSSGMMIPVNTSQSPKFRPRLQVNAKRHVSSSSEDCQRTDQSLSLSTNPAKDCVESLHQNARSQLIYGKNNVFAQPVPSNDPIPGYLSLHLNQNGLTLKWTPNQLMNGCSSNVNKALKNNLQDTDSFDNQNTTESPKQSSILWDYAISVNLSTIVYLHCHQHVDGDRIVLVGRDGVQYPPLHIKDKGGHLLAFLSCLENGLAPHGQLDPPLCFEKEQGIVFPKLHHRTDRQFMSISTNDDSTHTQTHLDIKDDDTSSPNGDYVFRIIFFDTQPSTSAKPSRWQWPSLTGSSQSSLSPPAHNQYTSASLPTSPTNVTIVNPPVNVTATIDLPKSASVRTSIASLCDTMRRQILSRAFYGWLAYCRHLKTVRTHLASLVYPMSIGMNEKFDKNFSLTIEAWTQLFVNKQKEHLPVDKKEIHQRIYSGGCDPSIRKQVWPFLFSHYSFESTSDERIEHDHIVTDRYHKLTTEWQSAEEIVNKLNNQRSSFCKISATDLETSQNSNEALPSSSKTIVKDSLTVSHTFQRKDSNISNDVFYEACPIHTVTIGTHDHLKQLIIPAHQSVLIARTHTESVIDRSSPYNIIETNTHIDDDDDDTNLYFKTIDDSNEIMITESHDEEKKDEISPPSSIVSTTDIYMDAVEILNDEQSNGLAAPIYYGSFTKEIIDSFSANLHRIDKDVARCDRNYPYFMNLTNLKKIRNIMCTYVWDNLTVGYIQGMCDIVAPLLVIYDEEIITYSCFCNLMKRLIPNFPHGTGMDENFGHMRSLLQILDSELYEHIHQTGDFTHFYFCYRWFLLDLKREFNYDDIFLVWEIIAAAQRIVSKRFVLFIALAMMKYYRDIILDNRMNFTDIIKFFNEMAERHDAQEILRIARELLLELQKLIDNK
ncbi:unnamed protein product [Rotaria magnacalcarata]|uniref:Small G protein signaling modulator 1 n=2 Tax=Rotaria magnacalcarata TaxID=392030 RepID=A0A816YR75_9BILA|nr:unnamed protein product [Rotaria magnacalcarata]CAF2170299.1 unnamed protein product [Rotaria magnacalcarata]CAF3852342.1 unnamed protein product [Rotaria magnacalcarata]CAF3879143.1 unnamed protein product [Rotaria magnacalcarata]